MRRLLPGTWIRDPNRKNRRAKSCGGPSPGVARSTRGHPFQEDRLHAARSRRRRTRRGPSGAGKKTGAVRARVPVQGRIVRRRPLWRRRLLRRRLLARRRRRVHRVVDVLEQRCGSARRCCRSRGGRSARPSARRFSSLRRRDARERRQSSRKPMIGVRATASMMPSRRGRLRRAVHHDAPLAPLDHRQRRLIGELRLRADAQQTRCRDKPGAAARRHRARRIQAVPRGRKRASTSKRGGSSASVVMSLIIGSCVAR